MIYYRRNNTDTARSVFFNLHEYIDNRMPDSVYMGYVICCIIYYVIAGGISAFMFGFEFYGCLCFIPFMIIEHCISYLFFYAFPKQQSKTRDIDTIQKRIEKLQTKEKVWDNKNPFDSVYDSQTIRSVKLYYRNCKELEMMYLNDVKVSLEKEKQKETPKNENKKDVRVTKLENYEKKINKYIEEDGIADIECISDAIKKLFIAINHKPTGIKLISNNLFVYFNELEYILDKYITLNQENKLKYQKDIIEIAENLTTNIKKVCEDIEKIETNDIEVSIKILLQELKAPENLTISDTTVELINLENNIFNKGE